MRDLGSTGKPPIIQNRGGVDPPPPDMEFLGSWTVRNVGAKRTVW